MRFERIVQTSESVAAAPGKKRKAELIAALLHEAPAELRGIAARMLSGETGCKTGVGYATVQELQETVPAAAEASLGIAEVNSILHSVSAIAGAGSVRARKEALGALFARATGPEHAFVSALLLGAIRQGALDALVVDAIAKAASLEAKAVRAAYMLAGEIGVVAEAALNEGATGLARFGLTVFRPVLPMLAQTAEDVKEALRALEGPASLEYKLDGFRLQVHKADDDVRLFTRALNEVTDTLPELVSLVRTLPARRLILDAEASALGATGRPLPFQDTMQARAKSRPQGTALTLTLFDLLLLDEQTLLSTAAGERFALLDALAPANRVTRLVTADTAAAEAFYASAIAAGHEGVMAKSLDAAYEAGNRGASWLKVKKVHRLDLVVVGVEWGSGRRKGTLSNLHLAARDPNGGEFVMVSKTFKGMTDETLAWQTRELLAREVDREEHIVHVRPELVVEIAFNDVQRSSQYPGGVALRHARLVRYRPDKTAHEADTIDAVRAIGIADGIFG